MEIRIDIIANAAVLNIHGSAKADDYSLLKVHLDNLLATNKLNIIINFENATLISSMIIGVILTALSRFKKVSGNLILCGMNDFISKVIKSTKVDRIIEIYPNLESALAARDSDIIRRASAEAYKAASGSSGDHRTETLTKNEIAINL